jgi:hypothetical protein
MAGRAVKVERNQARDSLAGFDSSLCQLCRDFAIQVGIAYF